nr:hypothetical protein [Tanacetum cinerariifolium]
MVLVVRPNCRFVLYELTTPHIPSSSELLDHVDDLVQVQHGGFTLALLDSLFSKGLRTVKSIPPKCCLGFSRVLKEAIDKVICTPDDISCSHVLWTGWLRAQHLMDCLSGAVVAIFDELVSSITQVVNLFLDGKCPNKLGEFIASGPLTPLVKPGDGIRPIDFGVGVVGRSEAILLSVNHFIEAYRDDGGLLMLLVDFKNAFNLVD